MPLHGKLTGTFMMPVVRAHARPRCVQLVVFVAKLNSALVATPDVHQSVFLRIIAHYTYACFIPVIVSRSSARAVTVPLLAASAR